MARYSGSDLLVVLALCLSVGACIQSGAHTSKQTIVIDQLKPVHMELSTKYGTNEQLIMQHSSVVICLKNARGVIEPYIINTKTSVASKIEYGLQNELTCPK